MVHSGFAGRRRMVVVVMIGGLLLTGCQVSTQPQDVSHFSSNRAGVEQAALYDGTYELFGDESDQSVGPLLKSVRLNKGDLIGFEVDANQTALAIAGHERLPLSPGHYRWQMIPDAGQTDWHRTNVMVIEVVVASAVVALVVVTTVLAVKGL